MIPIQSIQSSTGLSQRSVRRYLAKLHIRPVAMNGGECLYDAGVIGQIREAQLEALDRRRQAIRESMTNGGERIITVAEARRRAAVQEEEEEE